MAVTALAFYESVYISIDATGVVRVNIGNRLLYTPAFYIGETLQPNFTLDKNTSLGVVETASGELHLVYVNPATFVLTLWQSSDCGQSWKFLSVI